MLISLWIFIDPVSISAQNFTPPQGYQCLRIDRQNPDPGNPNGEAWAEQQRQKAESFKKAYEERTAKRQASGDYTAAEYLADQNSQLARTWSSGCNRRLCINILRGLGADGSLLPWAQIFNVGYWIPVVPSECVKCVEDWRTGGVTDLRGVETPLTTYDPRFPELLECPGGDQQTVPLPATLIPQIIIRLYGLLASISIYALLLVFAIIGIRYLVGGLAKSGSYTDTARDLRNVFSALFITLTAGTLLLQVLFSVLRVQDGLGIPEACIPTNDTRILTAEAAEQFKTFCNPTP